LEGVRVSREHGDLYQLEAMLRNLGMVGLMSGDLDGAKSWAADALRVARQFDNRLGQYYGLEALGGLAAATGAARVGAQLLGAAEALALHAGAGMLGPVVPFVAEAKQSAIDALGASIFDAEFKAGGRLSSVLAVQLALGEAEGVPPAGAGDVVGGPLGKREVEVGRLIVEGLSNKQIGARLFISERTVASHVTNIMNKLGLNTRAQIAVWMTSSA
jgi:DNA-binding CsgD family transcriptional regulator